MFQALGTYLLAIAFAGVSTSTFSQDECPVRVGEFSGTVKAEWLTKTRQMRLLEPFSFKGPDCKVWPVPKGAIVDGASIPQIFWSIIGGPFEGRYRDASVVHDYYCKVRTAASDDVHEMFYHAMLANGVDTINAGVMYYAVKWYGPRWQYLRKIGKTGDYDAFAVVRNPKELVFGTDFQVKASAAVGQPAPVGVRIVNPYEPRLGKPASNVPWLYVDGKSTLEHPSKPLPGAWTKILQGNVQSFEIDSVSDALKLYSTGPAASEPTEGEVARIKRWIAAERPGLATLKATAPEKLPN